MTWAPSPTSDPRQGLFPWPGEKRAALALTFDLDAESVWMAEDPANASRPIVLSQGLYAIRRGIGLILDWCRRQQVVVTFFVPGMVAERHPEAVRLVAQGGHELAFHGFSHSAP